MPIRERPGTSSSRARPYRCRLAASLVDALAALRPPCRRGLADRGSDGAARFLSFRSQRSPTFAYTCVTAP